MKRGDLRFHNDSRARLLVAAAMLNPPSLGQVYKAAFSKRRAARKPGKAAPSGPEHADADADAEPAAGPDAEGASGARATAKATH